MDAHDYGGGYQSGMSKVAETLANLSLDDTSEGVSTSQSSSGFSASGSLTNPWSSNGPHLSGAMSKMEDEDVASFVATAAASSVLYESEKCVQLGDNNSSITSKLSQWDSSLNDAADVWGFPLQQSGVSFPWNAPQQRSLSTGEWSSPLASNSLQRGKDASQGLGRSFSLSDEAPSLSLRVEEKYEPFLDMKDFVAQDKAPASVSEHNEDQRKFLRSMYSAPSGLMWNLPSNASSQRLSPAHGGDNGPSGNTVSNFAWDRQESLPNAAMKSADTVAQSKGQLETCGAPESLILSKILDTKGEFWGRIPIDQTTAWTALPVGNGVDLFDGNKSTSESNVWANEPPNGTRLWEEFYEMQGLIRSGRSGYKSINATTNPPRMVATSNSATPFQQASPGKMWPAASTGSSWEMHASEVALTSPTTVSDNMGWPPANNFASNSFGSNSEARRSSSNIQAQHPAQMTSSTGPSGLGNMSPSNLPRIKSDMTMRVQQVKYLCSLGFPRAEAQNALIMNNMDLDRALIELRERFGGSSNNVMGVSGLHSTVVNDLSMGYANGTLGPGPTRLPLNEYNSPGDGTAPTPHLGQQITQQFQYALNSRLNSMNPIAPSSASMATTPSMSSRGSAIPGADGHAAAATKLCQNYMLLQNRLKQINTELSHLQASQLLASQGGGSAAQQWQLTYRNLYTQQQQLYQQISILQTQLKSLTPNLFSSALPNPSPSNSTAPPGSPYATNLPGYLDSMQYGGMGGATLNRHLSQPYGGLPQQLNEFSLHKGSSVAGGGVFSAIPSVTNASANPSTYAPPLPISPPQSIFDPSGATSYPPWQR